MAFVDRVSAYPNRYMMTLENGSASYVVLERADEPITPGTPLNAETFNQYMVMVESEDFPGCFYHMVGDEMEWINPPMVLGECYRTTEVRDNKVVCIGTLDVGRLPDEGLPKTVDIPTAWGAVGIVEIRGNFHDSSNCTVVAGSHPDIRLMAFRNDSSESFSYLNIATSGSIGPEWSGTVTIKFVQ